ncbi:MAG: ABC transporter ATP-binding protein [Lachnospiraceae bacterium]|nr:ABC transporter ATP-binding protein [Lachnospiraceae bacterium]
MQGKAAGSKTEFLIRTEHLCLGYGHAAPVVCDVSLAIEPGEILCIVGESGSGKSTLLKAIKNPKLFGVKILDGDILDGGGNRHIARNENKQNALVHKHADRQIKPENTDRIGMIFQNPGASFNPIRTYRRQFQETLKSNGLFRGEVSWEEVLNMLDTLGLPDGERILDSCPYEMSGGMNQRIAIALTMLLCPRLILADEPTSALDVTLQGQVLDELQRARELSGTAIMLVTHNLGVAAKMADRIVVMHKGQIVECRRAEEVLRSPEDSYTKELLSAVPRILRDPSVASQKSPYNCSEPTTGRPKNALLDDASPLTALQKAWNGADDLSAKSRNVIKDCPSLTTLSQKENDRQTVPPVLEVRHLSKAYHQGRREIQAVQDISFTVREGEFLGIVGESGSGKSTLLRQISGLETPDTGEIRLSGKLLSPKRTKEDYQGMQMIFQEPVSSFDPRIRIGSSILENQKNLCRKHMRGGQQGGFPEKFFRQTKVSADQEKLPVQTGFLADQEELPAPMGFSADLEKLLAQTGLSTELKDRYPSALSGGQCQRAAISRAIAVGPKVLLCDEITSALDVSVQARIIDLLVHLAKERGMAVVFVSHDLALVSTICSRVMVMKDGACVEYQETGDLLNHPQNAYTRQLLEAVLTI